MTGQGGERCERIVVVLEYAADPSNADHLGRIAEALRTRAVHAPIEGARMIRSFSAVNDVADRICAEVPDLDFPPLPPLPDHREGGG